MLRENSNITALNLECNRIGTEGVQALRGIAAFTRDTEYTAAAAIPLLYCFCAALLDRNRTVTTPFTSPSPHPL